MQITLRNRAKKLLLVTIFTTFTTLTSYAEKLPDEKSQQEITQQLLELSVANIDESFSTQYISLINSKNTENYPSELQKSFNKIKYFRNFYESLDWSKKQSLQFKYKNNLPTLEDIEEFDSLVESGQLYDTLISIQPKTPNYNFYRKAINELLATIDLELPYYSFVLLNKHSYGKNVIQLKKLLKIKGYLAEDTIEDGYFNKELIESVKQFQLVNNLKADGVVGRITYDMLYKNDSNKAISLARSILRLSEPLLQTNESKILVNIPEMKVYIYDFENKLAFESIVVVGKKTTKTPLLWSKIDNVVFNPTWTVPKSIKEKDYIPKLREDPFYLQKRGLHIVGDQGVIDPSTLSEDNINNFKYKVVQNPGTSNALGLYKFNFPNPYSVYLHSTSSPSKFKLENRYLSHGCVRVEKSPELAAYLLRDTKYDEDTIAKIVKSRKTTWATLNTKPYIFIIYTTSYIDKNEVQHYFSDIYDYDEKNMILSPNLIKTLQQ